jgi:hypothetical protein
VGILSGGPWLTYMITSILSTFVDVCRHGAYPPVNGPGKYRGGTEHEIEADAPAHDRRENRDGSERCWQLGYQRKNTARAAPQPTSRFGAHIRRAIPSSLSRTCIVGGLGREQGSAAGLRTGVLGAGVKRVTRAFMPERRRGGSHSVLTARLRQRRRQPSGIASWSRGTCLPWRPAS